MSIIQFNKSTVLKAALLAAAIRYAKDVYDVYQIITESNRTDSEPVEDEETERKLVETYTNPKTVNKDEFWEVLRELEQNLPDEKCCGLFAGIEDPAVPIFREVAAGLTAGRAVLLQIAHPYIAKGVRMHSNVLTNGYDRAEKTRRFTFGMLYGSKTDILSASKQVRYLHAKVRGEIGEDVGIFNVQSPYDANQRDAIIWVAATMPDAIKLGYELAVRPITQEEREALIQVNRRFMMCFGVKAPYNNWQEYQQYFQAMVRSQRLLDVSEACQELYAGLFASSNVLSKLIFSYIIWVTNVMLPPRLCLQFYGRKMSKLDYFVFSLMVARIRFVYRVIPAWARYLPQYHFMARRAHVREHWAVTDLLIDGIDAFMEWGLKMINVDKSQEQVEREIEEARRTRESFMSNNNNS